MSQPLTLRTETGDEHLDWQEFEARIRRGEVSPHSLVKFAAITGELFVPACTLDAYKALHEPRQAYFSRVFSFSHFPLLTTALIFVHFSIYVHTRQFSPLEVDDLVRLGGKVAPMILDLGELWRLLTANFLHRDGLHLGLNMFVLFNVGRALENAYFRWDYAGLLVVSGIGAMATSLWLTDAVTVGASGMVYGGLGAVVSFGWKHRTLLPMRYRRILAEAALPTALGLLLLGVLPARGAATVDIWAHVGGLVSGMLYAWGMRPRLLVEHRNLRALRAIRLLPVGILLALWAAPPLGRGYWPRWAQISDDALGFSMPVPSSWRSISSREGQRAYYNGLPDLGRAAFAVEALPFSSAEAAAWHFEAEVRAPRFLGPEVLRVWVDAVEPTQLNGRHAFVVKARFEESPDIYFLRAYFVSRGAEVLQLLWTYPLSYAGYGTMTDTMVSKVSLLETQAIRLLRDHAQSGPLSTREWGELGQQWAQHGEWKASLEAFEHLVPEQLETPAFQTTLAWAWLELGAVDKGCTSARQATKLAPMSQDAWKMAARCEIAQKNWMQALNFTRKALLQLPDDTELLSMERKLFQLVNSGTP